jgi:hypothetical protein
MALNNEHPGYGPDGMKLSLPVGHQTIRDYFTNGPGSMVDVLHLYQYLLIVNANPSDLRGIALLLGANVREMNAG